MVCVSGAEQHLFILEKVLKGRRSNKDSGWGLIKLWIGGLILEIKHNDNYGSTK